MFSCEPFTVVFRRLTTYKDYSTHKTPVKGSITTAIQISYSTQYSIPTLLKYLTKEYVN